MIDPVRVASLCSGIGCSDYGLSLLNDELLEIPIAVENGEPERIFDPVPVSTQLKSKKLAI